MAAFETVDLNSLTSDQVAALTGGQVGALTQFQVGRLGTAQLAAIETNDLQVMRTSQLAALTTGQGGGFILSPSDHFFEAQPELLHAFADEARKCTYCPPRPLFS